jgi:hypothetical protein
MAKEKMTGQATQEQIDQWKKDNPDGVYAIEAETHVCYIKRPSRQVLSNASISAKGDPMKMNASILRQCWLGGSEAIRTDDRLFIPAGEALNEILQEVRTEVKKL